MTLTFFAAALLAAAAPSEPEPFERIRALEGNAFLVEEAYNLEENRVGQAATFTRKGGGWIAAAAQDWPVRSERHQIGYAISLASQGAAPGVGDAVLNYRYQLLSDGQPVAAAPHLAVRLPTGDARRGLGGGGVGVSLNLPFSGRVAEAVALHVNVGAGLAPGGRGPGGERTSAWNVQAGQSTALALLPHLHLVAEVIWSREQKRVSGRVERGDALIVNPGVRAGGNWGAAKIAVGAAVPWDVLGRGLSVMGFVAVELPFGEAPSAPPVAPAGPRAEKAAEEPVLAAQQ